MEKKEFTQVPIGQIGIVVPDVDAAVEWYSNALGIGPWRRQINSAPPLEVTYKGRPANYKVKLAVAQCGSVAIELIQYVDGDTIHRDFSQSQGAGVEHLGVYVPNLEEAMAPYLKAGVTVLQRADRLGWSRDGCYAYLDTRPVLGTILELIQRATQHIAPEQASS